MGFIPCAAWCVPKAAAHGLRPRRVSRNSTPATISLTEALTDADEVMERLHAAQT